MTQWLTLPLLIHKFGIDPVDQRRNSKHIRHVTTFLQIQKWIKNYTFAYLKNFVTRGHIVQWVFVFLTLAKCKISIHLNKWKRAGESDSIIYYQSIIFHLDSWWKKGGKFCMKVDGWMKVDGYYKSRLSTSTPKAVKFWPFVPPFLWRLFDSSNFWRPSIFDTSNV